MSNEINHYDFVGENTANHLEILSSLKRDFVVFAVVGHWFGFTAGCINMPTFCWQHGLKINLEFCKIGLGFSRKYRVCWSSHSRLDWGKKATFFFDYLFFCLFFFLSGTLQLKWMMLHNQSGLTGWQELFINNKNKFKHLIFFIRAL